MESFILNSFIVQVCFYVSFTDLFTYYVFSLLDYEFKMHPFLIVCLVCFLFVCFAPFLILLLYIFFTWFVLLLLCVFRIRYSCSLYLVYSITALSLLYMIFLFSVPGLFYCCFVSFLIVVLSLISYSFLFDSSAIS